MNSVLLIGRLTRDPELKTTSSGISFARFTLAVDRALSREKKREAEERGQATADFVNVVVWGKQAENCVNYLFKGSQAGVQGHIQTGSYEKDGVRKYTVDVIADRVEFLSAIKKSSGNGFEDRNQFDDNSGFNDIEVDFFQGSSDESVPFE